MKNLEEIDCNIVEMKEEFEHQIFARRIRQEMERFGLDKHSVTDALYIPKHRIDDLIKGRVKFREYERREFEWLFGILNKEK